MQPIHFRNLRNDGIYNENPIQKSILLPEQYVQAIPQKPRINTIEQFTYLPFKKQIVQRNNSFSNSNISMVPSNNLGFYQSTNPSSSHLISISSPRSQNNDELIHHDSFNNMKTSLSRSQIMVQPEQKYFQKDKQFLQGYRIGPSPKVDIDTQLLISNIIKQIKEKHLPDMLNTIKEEMHDDFYRLRAQFQILREQISNYKVKQLKFDLLTKDSLNQSFTKEERNLDMDWIKLQFFSMEDKLGRVELKMKEDMQKLGQKFQKQLKDKSIKVGSLKSSLPSIMLQYKQSFVTKNLLNDDFNKQIIFSAYKYFIDRQGYMLDSENHYLLDSKGKLIKLEEKHLQILEQNNILYR